MEYRNYTTYDGSHPNLVSNKLIKEIESKLNISKNNDNKIINGVGNFYNEYVVPNMFPIIVLTLLVIYLLVKYVMKRDREEREKMEKEQTDIKKSITQHMIKTDDYEKDNTKLQTENEIMKKLDQIGDDQDLADLISDDYLIEDLDLDDDGVEQNNDNLNMMMDRASPNDIDRITRMMLGIK